jgi:hypothetical protein
MVNIDAVHFASRRTVRASDPIRTAAPDPICADGQVALMG